MTLHEQIVLDARGKPTAVQLPLEEYKQLLDLVEDAADVQVAKARLKESRIPLTDVTDELKRDGLL
jgi:PHD/YefM family antitoxin component YafN of YafNO toxin-antitoxin module